VPRALSTIKRTKLKSILESVTIIRYSEALLHKRMLLLQISASDTLRHMRRDGKRVSKEVFRVVLLLDLDQVADFVTVVCGVGVGFEIRVDVT
jgi:hypothetical protein